MLQLIKTWLAHKYIKQHRIVFKGYTVLLFVLTLMPIDESQSKHFSFIQIPHKDKIIHFFLFFILTLLLNFAYKKLSIVQLILIPICIGIFIEVLQHISNLGRTFDVYDILANSLGVLIAVLLLKKFS